VIVRRLIWYASLAFVAGCARPTIPGPQLTCIPEGFGFDGHFQTTQRFLPGRQILEQRGYVVNGQDPKANYILIMTLSGPTSYESLLQNWNANLDRTGAAEWGPLQPLSMKHLPAWYWRVEWHDGDEQLIGRDIVAVVSDESSDKTYVLDFHATTPKYMDETVMQNALSSFRVKATSVSFAKLGAVIALAAGFAFVYTRARGTLA
jgi:hypothetical protein